LNSYGIRIYLLQSCLLVGFLEEVGVEGKKDSNNHVLSMGIFWEGHKKVPIRKASGRISSRGPFQFQKSEETKRAKTEDAAHISL
jgi:hypothetical protein